MATKTRRNNMLATLYDKFKSGSDISSIHRMTIDSAVDRKKERPFRLFLNQLAYKAASILNGTIGDSRDTTSCELGAYKQCDCFEEKYIPSPEVRALIEETKHVFSAWDKATIVWNSDYNLFDKYEELREIAIESEDDNLKMQIVERIEYDKRAFEQFAKANQGFIYLVDTSEYHPEQNIIGYYRNVDLAIEAGKKSGYSFTVEKHQIIEENMEDVPKEDFMLGMPVASISFDDKGLLLDYWSTEYQGDQDIKIDELSRERFENAYVVVPNPFHKGDTVCVCGSDRVGNVEVSQEEWKKYVEQALLPNAVEDWIDVSITVRYGDKWDYEHINPIYLRRVNDNARCNDFATGEYVIKGHDSGAAYWIRPVKIRANIKDKICDEDVTEFEGEISIEMNFFNRILLELFSGQLDMELMCNRLRYTYAYSDEGRFIDGFEDNLHHNFFTRDCIMDIVIDLEHMKIKSDLYEDEVVRNNCKKLAGLIKDMLHSNPDVELFSIITP